MVGSSDADADYTAGTETVHSMMQDYDSFEELEPEAYNEARTLFIQLRLTSLKVDFNLGTLYTKGKVEVEGVAARLGKRCEETHSYLKSLDNVSP